MSAIPVRINPPRQFLIPDDRLWVQSLCIRENASWICSARKAVRASGGGRNKVDTGSENASGESALAFLFGPSTPPVPLRLPRETEESPERLSKARLTLSPPIVRARTISKARNPTMSMVSSFCLRSRWEGRFKNSRKRFPWGTLFIDCCVTPIILHTFTIGKRGLATIRVMLVLVSRHRTRSFVCFLVWLSIDPKKNWC